MNCPSGLYGLVVLLVKSGQLVEPMLFVNRISELRHKNSGAEQLFHRLRALINTYRGNVNAALVDISLAERLATRRTTERGQTMLERFENRTALMSLRARVLWEKGFPDDASTLALRCIDECVATGDPLSLCYALANATCPIAAWTGNGTMLRESLKLLRDVSDEQSLEYWRQWVEIYEYALHDISDNTSVDLEIRHPFLGPLHHDVLATLDPKLLTESAVTRASTNRAGFALPEILRARGVKLLSNRGLYGAAAAETLFRQSIDVALKRGALSWALRAATTLARSMNRKGQPEFCIDIVKDLLSRFTQGFETRDFQDATALLIRIPNGTLTL